MEWMIQEEDWTVSFILMTGDAIDNQYIGRHDRIEPGRAFEKASGR